MSQSQIQIAVYHFGCSATNSPMLTIMSVQKVEASGVGVEGYGAILRTTDFESLLNQLEVLHNKLVGYAGLRSSYEPHTLLAARPYGRRIAITPDGMTQSHKFLFGNDQTY